MRNTETLSPEKRSIMAVTCATCGTSWRGKAGQILCLQSHGKITVKPGATPNATPKAEVR